MEVPGPQRSVVFQKNPGARRSRSINRTGDEPNTDMLRKTGLPMGSGAISPSALSPDDVFSIATSAIRTDGTMALKPGGPRFRATASTRFILFSDAPVF